MTPTNEVLDQPTINQDSSMSPSIAKLAEALAKAQLSIEGAKKDSTNPFFKSSYADLGSVWEACHKMLNENGLSVVQFVEDGTNNKVTVVTHLIHSSGEWMRSRFSLRPKADDPQGVGSAITYARRYSLAAMVGVCPVDDDGEAAMARPTPKPVSNLKNDKKTRIQLLMKQLGLQPTANTAEAWKHAVKAAIDIELAEENFDAIIKALETSIGEPPHETQ